MCWQLPDCFVKSARFMSRLRRICRVVVTVLAAFGNNVVSESASSRASETARPNVVMLMVDDLGWADLGCYGADLHETPNIDRFATGALRFTNAYAAAPVCTPTRAAWMTGKHPARLQMTIWHENAAGAPEQGRKLIPPQAQANLPHTEVTLAELFKSSGYRTFHVGKWHLGDAGHYPETHGFEANLGGTFWGAPATFFYPYRGLWAKREPRYVPGLHDGQPGEYLTDRLTDEALKFIGRHGNQTQPFFLNLCFHTVHTPIEGKTELVDHYRRKLKPEFHHRNATYAAMVHSLDQNVGRVLASLNELGITDRTIVIFSSDNGGYLRNSRYGTVTSNYPLRSGKGSLYEGGIRVPLMVRAPQRTLAATVCEEPVCTQDLFPTLVDICQLDDLPSIQDAIDGVSLSTLLNKPAKKLNERELFWHYPHYYPTTTPVSAVRSGRWKLLHYYEEGKSELYDLAKDVGEQMDVSETHAARSRELTSRLKSWLSDVGAQLPEPNPEYSR